MKNGYGESRCDLLISNLSESGQSRGYIRGGERDGNVRSGGNQTSLPRWKPGVSLPSLQTPLRMLNQLTVNLPWKRRASSTTSTEVRNGARIGATLSSEVSVSRPSSVVAVSPTASYSYSLPGGGSDLSQQPLPAHPEASN